MRRRFAAIILVGAVGAVGATASTASARPVLWWEPRASEFWVVNHAAIATMFDNGQCTQWVAERRPGLVRRMIERWVASEVRHRRPEMLPNLQARYWAIDARSVGVRTGTAPTAGALIVFQPGVLGAGREGHIAYVEHVYRDGSFEVSQMNAPLRYRVTYQTLPGWTAVLAGVRFIYRAR